ncbi:MAG: cache domain-containing protein, partial [Pontibacterium sp.]
MHLSNLRIHHKLLVLVGIAVVSTIITAFAAYNFTKQDVIESRLEQIRTMVASHKLPLKRIANARANVSNSELVTSLTQYINDASLSESYYLFLIKEDGTITAHGQNPSWVGKNAATIFDHDAGKQFLANLANNTNTQGFYAHYALPRSSGGKPVAKTAFLTAINNTPYYLGASAYLDNLVPFYKTSGALLILLSLIALIATVVMSYFISGNIARPLNQLAEQMKTLASGQLNTALDSTQRHDEMGDIARAMVSVADKISENQRLKAIHEKVMFLETFDPVTRLLNRKAFGEAINREISRNDQHGLAIAVFKFDLLHEIAIELGNHERDRVLLNLASRMHDSL